MMETLWAICAWTGFVCWCCLFIAAAVVAGNVLGRDYYGEKLPASDDDLPAN
jgi:membrane protein DedA with SNARE-associated domain